MLIYYTLSFSISRESDEEIHALLHDVDLAHCSPRIERHEGSVTVPLEFDPLLAFRSKLMLERAGYKVRITCEQRAEQPDQVRSALFQVCTRGRFVAIPSLSKYAKWDLSQACRSCGIGARQASHASLHVSNLPRREEFIRTVDGGYFVSTRLKDILLQHLSLEGCLQQIHNAARQADVLQWWQLTPLHTLPPLSKRSVGIARRVPCSQCDFGGYAGCGGDQPLLMAYDLSAAEIDSLPPLACSFEFWGDNRTSDDGNRILRYARQKLLVNRAVRDLLKHHAADDIELTPVSTNRDSVVARPARREDCVTGLLNAYGPD